MSYLGIKLCLAKASTKRLFLAARYCRSGSLSSLPPPPAFIVIFGSRSHDVSKVVKDSSFNISFW